MFSTDLHKQIKEAGILAVLVIDDAASAVPLAQALLEGGIGVMELTLRTDTALDALLAIRAEVPEMIAGVGTILSVQQASEALAAGAAFGVAPGLNRRVVEHAQDIGLPFAPGIMTPSDIEQGLELGCRTLKFFPAEPSGGLGYLKSIAGPYLHTGLDFIPLGGLSEANMGAYLNSPLIAAIGGSWIAPRETIAAKDWTTITSNARTACGISSEFRKPLVN